MEYLALRNILPLPKPFEMDETDELSVSVTQIDSSPTLGQISPSSSQLHFSTPLDTPNTTADVSPPLLLHPSQDREALPSNLISKALPENSFSVFHNESPNTGHSHVNWSPLNQLS